MKRIIIGCMFTLLGICSMKAVLPEVTLQDMNGKNVSVSSLAQTGKPIIISFFSTWCQPCMRELAALNEVYADWHDETGVVIYIVSEDQGQDVQKVKPLINGNGWEFKVLLDPNNTLKRAMNVQNLPHLFVIDSKGNIVYQHTKFVNGDEEEIRTYLQ